MDLEPSDITVSAAWAAGLLALLPADRWLAMGDGSDWSTRRTVDHLADTMWLYSAYVARRAKERGTPPRDGDPSAVPLALVDSFVSGALVLTRLLLQVGDEERIFHPSGLADRSGWVGMACTEILVHTVDATGLDEPLPSQLDGLANRVVDRVLPWTPSEGSGIDRLMWATGRRSLGNRPPEPADWWWQSAPLDEWAGVPRRRTAPPQWA